ncbi:hypothetical protein [Corynebacterium sp. ES2715-CONJ3]|uniref:hypothetical protein n=1 Tax=Corynebacterium sp. ES2715-CONJ3 TaxID=2974028 RepID=UPI002167E494|nr:hypothetical protein [Corynebacterium sp. ES2715-CONJ3]MCS4492484.1 hypothetical protein [Corynebacterium sp. ES2715-CONJ3]
MHNSDISLVVTGGLGGLRSLIERAILFDEHTFVRLQQVESGVEAFVPTGFGVLISRRVSGSISRSGAVLRAADLFGQGPYPTHDASWSAGALPRVEDFQLIDEIPAAAVYQLATQGSALARQFSGPLGPPQSLMNQTVITVSNAHTQVEIPMRMIFALQAFGLIPTDSAPIDIPRHLRVSGLGVWIRVDAPYGSAYYTSAANLLGL